VAGDRRELERRVVAALDRLYACGLVAFTDAATAAAPLIRGPIRGRQVRS
jgi:hypothetical protein